MMKSIRGLVAAAFGAASIVALGFSPAMASPVTANATLTNGNLLFTVSSCSGPG